MYKPVLVAIALFACSSCGQPAEDTGYDLGRSMARAQAVAEVSALDFKIVGLSPHEFEDQGAELCVQLVTQIAQYNLSVTMDNQPAANYQPSTQARERCSNYFAQMEPLV